jgi:hypothetical protein
MWLNFPSRKVDVCNAMHPPVVGQLRLDASAHLIKRRLPPDRESDQHSENDANNPQLPPPWGWAPASAGPTQRKRVNAPQHCNTSFPPELIRESVAT